jgi:predicted nicotinamide N-methyase
MNYHDKKESYLSAKGKINQMHQINNSTSSTGAQNDGDTNKPRNILITDATQPFEFSFKGRFAIHNTFRIQQTPDDQTWLGGALWDLGVIMAQMLVALSHGSSQVTLTTIDGQGKHHAKQRMIELPTRLKDALSKNSAFQRAFTEPPLILELGAGVGLTGLIAAAALNAKATVLTDLEIVVNKVTRPNLEINSVACRKGEPTRSLHKSQCRVMAESLCWGNAHDEKTVHALLNSLDVLPLLPKLKAKQLITEKQRIRGVPTLVLIGDVAYQHEPGAPSHFQDLLSTLLKFTDESTVVIFGTRIRMPASVDLLNMFHEHFEELVEPPIAANEINASFKDCKHNMSIHFLIKQSK